LADSRFNVTDLVELQMIENAISARLAEVEKVRDNKELISVEKEFAEVKEKFDEINRKYNDLESKRKKLEDTVEIQSEKIKSDEGKLFSGTITSSKELENYQEEIKMLKEGNLEMEDQILEIMIELEEMSEKIKAIQDEKDKVEAGVNRIKNEMNEKLEVLKNIVGGLKNRRDDVISRIPKDYLEKYKELKNKKGGIAVAVLKNDFCNVCNMQMPSVEAEKIDNADKVYRCPICGRMAIIFRDEIDNIKKELES